LDQAVRKPVLQKIRIFQRRIHSGKPPEFGRRDCAQARGAVKPNNFRDIPAAAIFDDEGVKQIRAVIGFGVNHAHRIKGQEFRIWGHVFHPDLAGAALFSVPGYQQSGKQNHIKAQKDANESGQDQNRVGKSQPEYPLETIRQQSEKHGEKRCFNVRVIAYSE
jgi:hypothetical protein